MTLPANWSSKQIRSENSSRDHLPREHSGLVAYSAPVPVRPMVVPPSVPEATLRGQDDEGTADGQPAVALEYTDPIRAPLHGT